MRRLKGIIVGIAGLVLALLLIEVLVPQASGITIGILRFLWIPFKEFFIQDELLSIGLFVIFAVSLFGTIQLSKRKEAHLWSIISGIVSICSFIGLVISYSNQ